MKDLRVETHRHLGGSIGVGTVWEIIKRTNSHHIAANIEQVKSRLTFYHDPIRNFEHFLRKFEILDEIPWPDWAIDLAIEQICYDLRADNIHTALLSLSIDKYIRSGGWSIEDVVSLISSSFSAHTKAYGVHVGLLLAVRYDAPRDSQLRSASLIGVDKLAEQFMGIDLVGNELAMDPMFHAGLIKPWRETGKIVRAHVGELPGTAKHVHTAINDLDVTNIAHGIYGDEDDWKVAADRGIYFDLAIISNLYTGAISHINQHPLPRMLAAGCRVTLSTDDPVQFGCSLDEEFNLAIANGLMDVEQVAEIRRHGLRVCGL